MKVDQRFIEAIDGVVRVARQGEYNRVEGGDMITFAKHYIHILELRKALVDELERQNKPKEVKEQKDAMVKKGKK